MLAWEDLVLLKKITIHTPQLESEVGYICLAHHSFLRDCSLAA